MSFSLVKSVTIILLLIYVQGLYSREIPSVIEGFNANTTRINHLIKKVEPKLSHRRLTEIRQYDKMKCFPKVLCTITKAEAFRKIGVIDLNEMADGYIRLLSAFPGGPPLTLVSTSANDFIKFKHDLQQYIQGSMAADAAEQYIGTTRHELDEEVGDENVESEEEEKDDSEELKKTRKGGTTENEDQEMLLTDPLLHQKEKMEMKKLMDELIEEENEAAELKKGSWAESLLNPISIPGKIGSKILKSVVIPYLTSRKRRDLKEGDEVITKAQVFKNVHDRNSRAARPVGKNEKESAIMRAVKLWSNLKDVSQCSVLYPNCPFEAWEVVSMIKLVGPE